MRSRLRPCGGADERGVSLLEVLVAIAVLSTALIAAMSGLFTSVKSSGANADRQQRSAAVSSYGESLKGLAYVPCSDATCARYTRYYNAWPQRWTPATGPTAPPDAASMVLAVTRVQYWNSSTLTFDAACPTVDGGAQRLTISVTWRGATATSTLVKRNPTAAPGAVTP